MDNGGTTRHTLAVSFASPSRTVRVVASRGVVAALLTALLPAAAAPAGAADGEWAFRDVSGLLAGPAPPEPGAEPRYDYGPLWGDLDGDGWIDLLFMNHGDPPSLYRNGDGARFEDRFEKSGLRKDVWLYPQHQDRHGGACADYDADGDVDLVITHGAMRGETLGVKFDELLANQGDGTFAEVSKQAGVLNEQGRARTPVWLDYDNDGLLDLLIGNFISPNVLLRNRGDGTFHDVAAELGVDDEGGAHPSWTDWDGDGDPDLLTLWPVGMSRNDGQGGFTPRPVSNAPGEPWVPGPVATAWGDFDGDGDADVFIASRQGPLSRLFANQAGRFAEAPLAIGLGPDEGGAGAAWGDLDNDGDLDLVVLGTRQARLLENRGAGGFTSRALPAPGLRPGVDGDVDLADFDHDGRLDLAINAEDGQHLFRNELATGSWLVTELRGSASNAGGLGATVSASAAGPIVTGRQHLGDTGFHKSVSCAPLHLGLGESDRVELEIRWPSGRRERLAGVPTRRRLVLPEPAG